MVATVASVLGAEVLGALSGSAREALPFIVHGVSRGLSANSIGAALQAGGMGIRRSNLLTLVRAIRGTMDTAAIYQGLAGDVIPPSYIFHPAATFMRNPFAYILRVVVSNNITGLMGTRNITVSSPTALSNDQIADYAEEILLAEASAYNETYISHSIDEVLVDPRFIP